MVVEFMSNILVRGTVAKAVDKTLRNARIAMPLERELRLELNILNLFNVSRRIKKLWVGLQISRNVAKFHAHKHVEKKTEHSNNIAFAVTSSPQKNSVYAVRVFKHIGDWKLQQFVTTNFKTLKMETFKKRPMSSKKCSANAIKNKY